MRVITILSNEYCYCLSCLNLCFAVEFYALSTAKWTRKLFGPLLIHVFAHSLIVKPVDGDVHVRLIS